LWMANNTRSCGRALKVCPSIIVSASGVGSVKILSAYFPAKI
jgi:hypothetical protein